MLIRDGELRETQPQSSLIKFIDGFDPALRFIFVVVDIGVPGSEHVITYLLSKLALDSRKPT